MARASEQARETAGSGATSRGRFTASGPRADPPPGSTTRRDRGFLREPHVLGAPARDAHDGEIRAGGGRAHLLGLGAAVTRSDLRKARGAARAVRARRASSACARSERSRAAGSIRRAEAEEWPQLARERQPRQAVQLVAFNEQRLEIRIEFARVRCRGRCADRLCGAMSSPTTMRRIFTGACRAAVPSWAGERRRNSPASVRRRPRGRRSRGSLTVPAGKRPEASRSPEGMPRGSRGPGRRFRPGGR